VADYEHLHLVRLPEQLERRKRRGFGVTTSRDHRQHSTIVRNQLDAAIAVQQRRRPAATFVNPALILRVQVTGAFAEEDWERLGLTVLSRDEEKSLLLFASDIELRQFHERISAYEAGPRPGEDNAPYAGFMSNIESVGSIQAVDRIGDRFKAEGYVDPASFFGDELVSLDVELWHLGPRGLRLHKVEELSEYVRRLGGEALDSYVGPSLTLVRVRVRRATIGLLLEVEEVAIVDLPPQPDLATEEILDLTIADLPATVDAAADTPVIGIIDSGINAHPLMEGAIVGAVGVPDHLGAADDWGHGTRVGGVAVFGDLRAQLEAGQLVRGARLCSAKVVNDRGDFDDRTLVPTQMRAAISRLHGEFGCRIFVISLADRRKVYDGGKVGPWAAALDELARDLNVLIVVSAGNRHPRGGTRLEEAITAYPEYLLEASNRLYEPAAAVNVLTVGSLAHANGLDAERGADVRVRPIAERLEPSPFTRAGPGVRNGLKPDLVDFGGTMVYDPVVMRLLEGKELPAAGLLTLNHIAAAQLFVGASGTSYAAPMVAFKAAQLLRVVPNASANLLRALLACGAEVPAEAIRRLSALSSEEVANVCGRGYVDAHRAAYSQDNRVVLVAEDELPLDHFAIYEIPIPPEYQQERGDRMIRVTLAYDPPVRHSRTDYTGVGMNFRLFRGCESALLFEHFRRREQEEGRFPEIENRYGCKLVPTPTVRERSTLQSATVIYKRDLSQYGDRYYLVVRCERAWASEDTSHQRFAVAVELSHRAEIRLYDRLRVRVPA
jgi:hypothetical protein